MSNTYTLAATQTISQSWCVLFVLTILAYSESVGV